MGIRSINTLTLAKVSTTNYDFTTGLGQVFKGTITNNPMATLVAGTTFGLWSGNANDDVIVKMIGLNANQNDYLKLLGTLGSSIQTIPNAYSKQDLNLDGIVKMTGLNSTQNDYLRLLSTLGSSITVITQPIF